MSAGPVNLPVLGAMPRAAAAAKLREVGEDRAAEALERAAPPSATFGTANWWPFGDKGWQHTAHAIGFLPAGGSGMQTIIGVGEAQADPSLKNARINVALNTLRVADYPGRGTHRILFDFYARNQVMGASEDLHFNSAYRAREGERAAVRFYPIFVGLGVGAVAFHFHTVNVKTDADEAFLDFLDGDAFKAGLKLVPTAQPAIAPLSGMALALTKSIAGRNRNVSVQDCDLGFDFAGTAMGARLAVGDDIAAQVPETLQRVWDWQDWVYEPRAGLIVSRDDPNALIPYNSVVFGVSRTEGE